MNCIGPRAPAVDSPTIRPSPVSTRLTAASTSHGHAEAGLGLVVVRPQLLGGWRLDDPPGRQRVGQLRDERAELADGPWHGAGRRRGSAGGDGGDDGLVPLRVLAEPAVGDLLEPAGGVDDLGRGRRVADRLLGIDDLGGERGRVLGGSRPARRRAPAPARRPPGAVVVGAGGAVVDTSATGAVVVVAITGSSAIASLPSRPPSSPQAPSTRTTTARADVPAALTPARSGTPARRATGRRARRRCPRRRTTGS